MGKAAMCLQMLQILNTGRIYKVSELAGLLDTNPRNVIEYKKELDELSVEFGFYIDNICGRYGGYKLNGNAVLPATKFSEEEKRVLVEAFNHLLTSESFVEKQSATIVFSKIMSNLMIEDKHLDLVSVNKYSSTMNVDEIKRFYRIIDENIKAKRPIIIDYNFLKEPRHKVKVDPYKLFLYDNEWKVVGWSHDVHEPFDFKLSRINDIEVTNERPFRVSKTFDFQKYLKDGVFSHAGEMFPLSLIASGIRAKLFKEKVYGKNQVIEDLPDGKIKITMEMQKNHSTYNFILGCGDLVEVVEPKWLRKTVRDLARSIASINKLR